MGWRMRRWFLLPGQQFWILAKGRLHCLSAHTAATGGSFWILGVPTLSRWTGRGHWWSLIHKPRRSKLWSWLLLGTEKWAEDQLMWVIASLCWEAGCCKPTQGFSCFPGHWNVSLLICWLIFPRNEWLLALDLLSSSRRAGCRGSPWVHTLSGAQKSGVAMLMWGLPGF